MLYELRTYYIVPGRMDDINARFRDHTMNFFGKYGIEVVGFWTEVVGRNDTLVYITAFENMAQRDAKWTAFVNDPEWLRVRAETEADGAMVARVENRFLAPTDYSPLK